MKFKIFGIVILLILIVSGVYAIGDRTSFSGITFDGIILPEIQLYNSQTISGATSGKIIVSRSTELNSDYQKTDTLVANTYVYGDSGLAVGYVVLVPEFDPSVAYGFTDEFLGESVVDTIVTASSSIVPRWMYSIDSTTYAPSQTSMRLDTVAGVLTLSVGGADNDSTYVVGFLEAFKTDTTSGKRTWFECRISLPDTTQFEWAVGLAQRNDIGVGTIVKNGIFFTNSDGSDSVKFHVSRGGAVDSAVAIANFQSSTWYTLAFYADGKGNVKSYVDGTLISTETRYTPRTVNMTPFIYGRNGEASAARKSIHVDYIKIVQER